MLLDIEDERVRLKLTFPSQSTARLTLEYPREEAYRVRVMAALAAMLHPDRPGAAPQPAVTPGPAPRQTGR